MLEKKRTLRDFWKKSLDKDPSGTRHAGNTEEMIRGTAEGIHKQLSRTTLPLQLKITEQTVKVYWRHSKICFRKSVSKIIKVSSWNLVRGSCTEFLQHFKHPCRDFTGFFLYQFWKAVTFFFYVYFVQMFLFDLGISRRFQLEMRAVFFNLFQIFIGISKEGFYS